MYFGWAILGGVGLVCLRVMGVASGSGYYKYGTYKSIYVRRTVGFRVSIRKF